MTVLHTRTFRSHILKHAFTRFAAAVTARLGAVGPPSVSAGGWAPGAPVCLAMGSLSDDSCSEMQLSSGSEKSLPKDNLSQSSFGEDQLSLSPSAPSVAMEDVDADAEMAISDGGSGRSLSGDSIDLAPREVVAPGEAAWRPFPNCKTLVGGDFRTVGHSRAGLRRECLGELAAPSGKTLPQPSRSVGIHARRRRPSSFCVRCAPSRPRTEDDRALVDGLASC